MSYTSTVPQAITNLVATLSAWPDLEGVEVVDGPPTEGADPDEGIAVGYSPNEDVDAVEMSATGSDLSGRVDRESYTVHCTLSVVAAGDGSAGGNTAALVEARVRAYVLFGAVGSALVADQTLGGAVTAARLADHALRQDDTDHGMLARINFSVSVDAFTGR